MLTEKAAKQQSMFNHHGTLGINPHKSTATLLTHAVATLHLKHNILSVHDLATRYGLVSFTKNAGYIIKTKKNPPVILAKAR